MSDENGKDKVLVDLYNLQRNIIYDIHAAKAVTRRKKLEKLMKTGRSINLYFYRPHIVVPKFVEDNLLEIINKFCICSEPTDFQFDLWRYVARYKKLMGLY